MKNHSSVVIQVRETVLVCKVWWMIALTSQSTQFSGCFEASCWLILGWKLSIFPAQSYTTLLFGSNWRVICLKHYLNENEHRHSLKLSSLLPDPAHPLLPVIDSLFRVPSFALPTPAVPFEPYLFYSKLGFDFDIELLHLFLPLLLFWKCFRNIFRILTARCCFILYHLSGWVVRWIVSVALSFTAWTLLLWSTFMVGCLPLLFM